MGKFWFPREAGGAPEHILEKNFSHLVAQNVAVHISTAGRRAFFLCLLQGMQKTAQN